MRKRYYNLNEAKRYKSKTKPYPFLVAHECYEVYKQNGETKERTREYIAFNDLDEFLSCRSSYPYAHEVIFDRFSDKQQGRLIFDFDFDTPWYGLRPQYVSPTFESDIQAIVIDVFKTYYIEIDTTRFKFVWLVSDTVDKWSKHLIVKNAFFSEDWKQQILVFYQLMLGHIETSYMTVVEDGVEKRVKRWRFGTRETADLIDVQVARNNATMRMLGSSKMKGKVLHLDRAGEDFTFADSLVQLYRKEDILSEQHIQDRQLNKKLLEEIYEGKQAQNKFLRQACVLANIDLTRIEQRSNVVVEQEQLNHIFEMFRKSNNAGVFHVKDTTGSIINLVRNKPAVCVLSGKVHDHENAFLSIQENGKVYFHCRRGCVNDSGANSVCIGDSRVDGSPTRSGLSKSSGSSGSNGSNSTREKLMRELFCVE
jgi:hypothetical protein